MKRSCCKSRHMVCWSGGSVFILCTCCVHSLPLYAFIADFPQIIIDDYPGKCYNQLIYE